MDAQNVVKIDLSSVHWRTQHVWLEVLWKVQQLTGKEVHRNRAMDLTQEIYAEYVEPHIEAMTGKPVTMIDESHARFHIMFAVVTGETKIEFELEFMGVE